MCVCMCVYVCVYVCVCMCMCAPLMMHNQYGCDDHDDNDDARSVGLSVSQSAAAATTSSTSSFKRSSAALSAVVPIALERRGRANVLYGDDCDDDIRYISPLRGGDGRRRRRTISSSSSPSNSSRVKALSCESIIDKPKQQQQQQQHQHVSE
eukprot:GHVU01021228.1.p1 GENE.GHVU01021228.1~~GHVU01021228.1.p1  ORF type:complete len:152 (+),score=25.10 GHVU01021228.1:170-625(+)